MPGKLKLNLDQLSVDSFDTSTAQRSRGTVRGEQCTCYTNCTCPGCPTCDASCNGTCGAYTCAASCNGTCGAASCNGTCGAASCGYSCNYTDCDCLPATCQNTNCGMEVCCGITGGGGC
jgi:hypothetical protein